MSLDSTKRFQDAVWDLIHYYSKEYDITTAEAIGVLQIICFDLISDCPKEDGGDDEEA